MYNATPPRQITNVLSKKNPGQVLRTNIQTPRSSGDCASIRPLRLPPWLTPVPTSRGAYPTDVGQFVIERCSGLECAAAGVEPRNGRQLTLDRRHCFQVSSRQSRLCRGPSSARRASSRSLAESPHRVRGHLVSSIDLRVQGDGHAPLQDHGPAFMVEARTGKFESVCTGCASQAAASRNYDDSYCIGGRLSV